MSCTLTRGGHFGTLPDMTDTTDMPPCPLCSARRKQEALARFNEIIEALRAAGWEYMRVDTLVHPLFEHADPIQRPVILHHYVAGVWTITLGVDRNLQRPYPDAPAVQPAWQGTEIKLIAGKDLPSAEGVVLRLLRAIPTDTEETAERDGQLHNV